MAESWWHEFCFTSDGRADDASSTLIEHAAELGFNFEGAAASGDPDFETGDVRADRYADVLREIGKHMASARPATEADRRAVLATIEHALKGKDA